MLARLPGVVVAAVLVMACAAGSASAASGDKDPTWGNNQGRHYFWVPPIPPANDTRSAGEHVLIDASGRLIVAGNTLQRNPGADYHPYITRITPSAATDTTFGTNGYVTPQSYSGNPVYLRKIDYDSSRRLYGLFIPQHTNTLGITARYTANGTLDNNYGNGGLGTVGIQTSGFWTIVATALAPDGSSYFVVTDVLGNATEEFLVIRLDPNGNPVASYETNSRLSVPNTSNDGQGDAPTFAEVDSQGRLLVGRSFKTGSPVVRRFEIRRFTTTGAPDTTWGTNGRALFVHPSGTDDGRIRDMEILPNDEVLVSVTGTTNYIAKLTNTGQYKASFGAPTIAGTVLWQPIHQDPDGRVYVLSRIFPNDEIRRFTSGGQLDATFNGDGIAIDEGADDYPADLNSTTGRLYLASNNWPATVTRYLTQDPSLSPDLVTSPRVFGTPSAGQTLRCDAGAWTTSPTVEVFWDRGPRSAASDDDPAWTQLPTVGRDYSVTETDVGSRLRCRERATNNDGSAEAPSNSLRVDSGAPAVLRAPTVTGIPVKGQALLCEPGEWSNGPDLTAAWLRDGANIANAESLQYTVREEDRRHRITCEVSGQNDVGSGGPARATNDLLAVGAPPETRNATPTIDLERTGPRPTDVRLTCGTGDWDEDYGEYDWRWLREGAEIAGATGRTYNATVADLGQNIRCEVWSTNPAGRSDRPQRSFDKLVPLPATGEPGGIYTGGGHNRLDPLNLLAVTKAWQEKMTSLTVERRRATAEAVRKDCAAGEFKNAGLPDFGRLTSGGKGVYMSLKDTCGVLLRAPADQLAYPLSTGIYWAGNGACRVPNGTSGVGNPCPTLRITVPRLNAASPPTSITALEQATLDSVKPVRVLWDFNRDGRTDASCDPDAPILRTLPTRGIYNIRAVIISADSEATGLYSVTDLRYDFYGRHDIDHGRLRDAQPFACKTTLTPPDEPDEPCINEATIGRTHIEGNICPISARKIPERDLAGLPQDVQRMLEKQALDEPLKTLMPKTSLKTDVSYGLGIGFRAVPGSLAHVTTRQVDALSSIGNAAPASVSKAWETDLKKNLPNYNVEEGQFAMDQIYAVRGQAKLNGIDLDPSDGSLTVIVPSDAGSAVKSIKNMTISARKVAMSLGGVPFGDPAALSQDLKDEAKAAVAPVLKAANLDALKASLLKKLDLGPFKLAGDAKLRMADDGTAFIDAMAELKGPFKAGSSPIRTGVTVRANQSGKLSLEGIRLSIKKAYMGAVAISGLDLQYSGNGLSIKGKLLFPPVNQGIEINRFRLDGKGDFQELDISYLAGAGQGINIGPGIFLVKLGGGLSLNPDEIRARAGVSFGPSPGGGCPTAGVDADLNVHLGRPPPFFVDARATVQLVCIPMGNAHFYAEATGLVDVEASASLDLGPIYANAALHGRMRLPDWQIDMRGRGGIRKVFSGEVKAILSNLGLAGCGRVEVFPETPFSDSVTIAGGAGVRFSNGRPPFTYAELLANLDLFTGCSLTSYSPFGRGPKVTVAQSSGERSFTLGAKDSPDVLALEVRGAGGAPRVQVVNPKGEVLDASGFGDEFVRTPNISGMLDPAKSRTLLFLRGAPGKWTVRTVDGSVPISDIRRADVLPAPKVSGKVGGVGASRILQYKVQRIPGQTVRFVEQSAKGQRIIKTVRGGGSGKANFITSEGPGTKRTILAEVSQGGMPRETLTVARFSAPPPKPARPRLTARRRGSAVTLKWRRDRFTARFEISVATGRGRRFMLEPKPRATSAKFGGLVKGEGATIRIVGISPGGRRGPVRTVKVKGSMKLTTGAGANRWQTSRRSGSRRGK